MKAHPTSNNNGGTNMNGTNSNQNLGNLSNFDTKSQNNNNFSTTTKSKFNTIDQYNNNGGPNQGSNSRHNSPVRQTN
jgi:hypothetical protein